ncbi:MAG: fumarate reductase subunit C [Nocardioidaceae bacterium]
MSNRASYTEFHPRWYRRPISTWWWLGKWTYLAFILRELSSIFVAWFVIFMLLLVRAIGQGDAEYQRFLDRVDHPLVVLLNLVALAFVIFHMVTWFHLTPQAMVVRVGGRRVRPRLIAASQYIAWLVVSVFVLWLLVGG